MNLGELEFKAEDFSGISYGDQNFADRANGLLRERLEKAQKVYTHELKYALVFWAERVPNQYDTHTARLVCIEEMK